MHLPFYARLGSPKITISQFITWGHRPRDDLIIRIRHKPREDLIIRMRETMKNWGHIVNCKHYNKFVGIMKYPMGCQGVQLGPFIKTKSHKLG